MLTTLSLSAIKVDASIQCRAALNQATVAQYAERMKAGDKFPPLVAFDLDGVPTLSDGFHRHPAAQMAKLESFPVEIRHGSRKDAIKFAIQANSVHGLPRSNKDKRRAVELALAEFDGLSDHAIAQMCKVSQTLVSKMRPQLKTDVSCGQRTGRDGKRRKMPKGRASGEPHAPASEEEPAEPANSSAENVADSANTRTARSRETAASNAGAAPRPPRVFDPVGRWEAFSAVLDEEYAIWPPARRSVFVQNLVGWIEGCEEASE